LKRSSGGSYEELLARAIRYCEYQERCKMDVSRKLDGWKLTAAVKMKILDQLTDLGCVDDERYAKTYAGSKFRVNGWGKVRIRAELRVRQIGENIIEKALSVIGQDAYVEELDSILRKKKESLNKYPARELKGRLYRFAASRGYESGVISEVLNRILID
jgi:regulatory protein